MLEDRGLPHRMTVSINLGKCLNNVPGWNVFVGCLFVAVDSAAVSEVLIPGLVVDRSVESVESIFLPLAWG